MTQSLPGDSLKCQKKTFHAARGTAIWVGFRRSARELILSYNYHYIYLFIIYLISRPLRISLVNAVKVYKVQASLCGLLDFFSKQLT